jgi:hypothetical protein
MWWETAFMEHLKKPTSKPPVRSSKIDGSTAWPKQYSGSRFEYRELNGEWQVYGEALIHVCMCVCETNAAMVTRALNKQMP